VTESSHAVFLSYASEDAAAAERIATALRDAGIEVWFDKEALRGGDAWDRMIRQQIHDCALFIPLISQHSQERLEGYFRLEWKLAVDRSHRMAAERPFIVPVVVDSTRERDALVVEQVNRVGLLLVEDSHEEVADADLSLFLARLHADTARGSTR